MVAGVAAFLSGCGSAESSETLFQPIVEPPPVEAAPAPPAEVTPAPPPVTVPPPMPEVTPAPPPAAMPVAVTEAPPVAPVEAGEESRCRPALGVSGTPQSISEAIVLLNTLPKPVTLACFIEALDRPLTLYMTKSDDSLQPSPGARSPRTFILRGQMEMSIVLDGPARDTLEFGYRPEPTRSIKAEVLFPIMSDVSETSLFDRVQVTERTTRCGACHVGEAHQEYPGFPLGVFESDTLDPYEFDEVSLESMQAEADACDESMEPYRCGLLSALFDHGDLVSGALGGGIQ